MARHWFSALFDRRVAPHHRHARRQRLPRRRRVDIFEIERRHVLDLPAKMIVCRLHRLYRCIAAPRLRKMTSRRQMPSQGLIHYRDRRLDLPIFRVHVGPQMPFGFACHHRAWIATRRIQNAETLGGLQIRAFVGSDIFEIRVLGLKLPSVCGDRPGAEVVELRIGVVLNFAVRELGAPAASECALHTLPLHRMVLAVNRRSGIRRRERRRRHLRRFRRRRLGCIKGPLRRRFLFVSGIRETGAAKPKNAGDQNANWHVRACISCLFPPEPVRRRARPSTPVLPDRPRRLSGKSRADPGTLPAWLA